MASIAPYAPSICLLHAYKQGARRTPMLVIHRHHLLAAVAAVRVGVLARVRSMDRGEVSPPPPNQRDPLPMLSGHTLGVYRALVLVWAAAVAEGAPQLLHPVPLPGLGGGGGRGAHLDCP